MCGNTPPRRETRKDIAPTIAARASGGGGLGTDFDLDGRLVAPAVTSKWAKGVGGPSGDECQNLVVARALRAQGQSAHDHTLETYIAHTLSAEGFDASEDGTGRGIPIIPFDTTQLTSRTNRSAPKPGNPCHTLSSGGDAPAIAFTSKDYGANAQDDLAPTLRAMGHKDSHPNSGGQIAIAATSSVRRLTPRECERLQGFDDDYTLIPAGKRNWTREIEEMRDYFLDALPGASDEELIRLAADGPRYKALGNSKAVPVVRWIGERIDSELRRAA